MATVIDARSGRHSRQCRPDALLIGAGAKVPASLAALLCLQPGGLLFSPAAGYAPADF